VGSIPTCSADSHWRAYPEGSPHLQRWLSGEFGSPCSSTILSSCPGSGQSPHRRNRARDRAARISPSRRASPTRRAAVATTSVRHHKQRMPPSALSRTDTMSKSMRWPQATAAAVAAHCLPGASRRSVGCSGQPSLECLTTPTTSLAPGAHRSAHAHRSTRATCGSGLRA
jgi:hypothetical protein